MKILTKKGFVNKLIIVLLAVLIFGTIIPTNASYAASDDFGGKLLKPIVDLLLALGDLIMDLLHNVVYGMNTAILKIDLDNNLLEFLVIAIAVVIAIVAVISIGWGVAVAGAKLLAALGTKIGVTIIGGAISAAAIGTIVVSGIEAGIGAGMFVRSNWFSNEAALPIYKISPEEIFTGEVYLLNANFFSQREIAPTDYSGAAVVNTTTIEEIRFDFTDQMITQEIKDSQNAQINTLINKYGYTGDTIDIYQHGSNSVIVKWENEGKAYQAEKISTITSEDPVTGSIEGYNTIRVSAGEWQGSSSIAEELKTTIAKWYYALRNLALVAMMIILLYIGIRIMLCGVASEKAKYKNMLVDWLVAICLIFVMHYIMVFAMNITESIIELFSSVNSDKQYIAIIQDEKNNIKKSLKSSKELKSQGVTDADIEAMFFPIDENGNPITNGNGNPITDENGNPIQFLHWDAKNIMGLIRVQAALSNSGTYLYIGYVMCFLVLVWYTLFFFVTYLKRILYLAFFTVIAPLVAMTYPLDKMHDGKAQAFDMWLKEYIFNLLIQPMHLLLYTVLINSAFELASENIIYTLVAIGFMMPAEKFVRKMFGFDKAQTPGFLGGAAGAAVALTAFNKVLNRRHPKGGGKSQGNLNEKDDKGNNTKLMDNSDIDPMKLSGVKDDVKDQGVNVLSNRERQRKLDETKKQEESKFINAAQNALADTLNSNKYNMYKPQIDKVNKVTLPKTDGQKKLEEDMKKAKAEAEEKAKLKKSRWGGIKGASKEFARQKLQRGVNYFSSGKPIKDFSRMSKGLAVGTGAAMLGATLGIAAEDPKKVGQYAGTLGAAGYAIGARDTHTNVNEEAIRDEYNRGLYGSDEAYRKAMLEEQRAEVIENEKNLKKLRENLGLEDLTQAKEKLDDYGDCIDAGITDMDDISTIIKLVEEQNWERDMAKTAAKYYKKAGSRPSKMGKRDRENIEYIYSNIAKSNGITEETQIRQVVDTMLGNIEIYGKTKDKLTDV